MEPQISLGEPIKLDIGCGPNKQPGHIGLDQIAFPGVDHVIDAGRDAWPFDRGSVASAHSSHFAEHLTAIERVFFFNELYRVLAVGGQCQLIVPHWGSCRAYGDPTHQWPPIGEFTFYYLSREWRMANAPHTDRQHWDKGYDCDFDVTWGYSLHPALASRNGEYQQFALQNYKEAAQDIIATLTKKNDLTFESSYSPPEQAGAVNDNGRSDQATGAEGASGVRRRAGKRKR
jgi:hypothetical protein